MIGWRRANRCTSRPARGIRVDTYLIPVRNEFTGEVRVVAVASHHVTDAQISALQLLFRDAGWRKAIALLPESRNEARTA